MPTLSSVLRWSLSDKAARMAAGKIQGRLKNRFFRGLKITRSEALTFQHVLPHGTCDEVIAETRKCLETLGLGGGYLPCSCHNMQAGTPVENILAMIETVHRF